MFSMSKMYQLDGYCILGSYCQPATCGANQCNDFVWTHKENCWKNWNQGKSRTFIVIKPEYYKVVGERKAIRINLPTLWL